MKVTVVGVRKGTSKNGRNFCQYFVTKPFSDYDISNGDCSGFQTASEFTYRDYGLKVGDVCDFQYEPGFEGRATLSDVVVLVPSDKKDEAKAAAK